MLRASATHLSFTSLYPQNDDEFHPSDAPSCNIVKIDNLTILLDCGCPRDMQLDTLEEALRPYIGQIDCVLLSSPEVCFCGGLPLLVRLSQGRIPTVYATVPITRLGVLNTVTQFLSQYTDDTFPKRMLSVQQIYDAFRAIREVPLSGRVCVASRNKTSGELGSSQLPSDGTDAESGASTEVEIKPVRGGRVLGACAWRITHQTDDLLYAPMCSIKHSFHVKGFDVPSRVGIALLDASTFATEKSVSGEDSRRDCVKAVRDTLRRGGDVLLPVDACCRGIEVISLLSQKFEEEGLTYKLIFLFPKVHELCDRLSAMVEYLREGCFSEERGLLSAAVTMARSSDEVLQLSGPKCVVAHSSTLQEGGSAELLQWYLSSDKHSVIFTEAPSFSSTAARLFKRVGMSDTSEGFTYSYPKRVMLEGVELEEYIEMKQQEDDRGAASMPTLSTDGTTIIQDAELSDYGSDEEAVDAASPQQMVDKEGGTAKAPREAKALFLPRGLSYASKYLQFPPMEPFPFISDPNGLPLTPLELSNLQRWAPKRTFDDSGPSLLNLTNRFQQQDHAPCKIVVEERTVARVLCKLQFIDLSGRMSSDLMQHMLRAAFKDTQKLVFIRGTLTDAQRLQGFCESEKLSVAQQIYVARTGVAVDLAKAVMSFNVKLEPSLLRHVMPLRRVQDGRGDGQWDVGWIVGQLSLPTSAQSGDHPPASKKARIEHADGSSGSSTTTDAATIPRLCLPSSTASVADGSGATSHIGSYFVGEVDLSSVRESCRQAGHEVEQLGATPLIIVNGSVFVHRPETSKKISIEAMASVSQYEVRRIVYERFPHIL